MVNIVGSVLPRNLNRSEKAFVKIPRDVIRYNNDKLVLTFIYFAVRKGLDDSIYFTVNSLVTWCGYIPNNRENRTNENFINAIRILNDLGYISVDVSKLSRKGNELVTAIFECEYLDENIEKFKMNNDDGLFAILYIDEIDKILSYKFKGKSNQHYSIASLITVFSYLRSMIYLNGISSDNGKPEAYYDYYYIIAEKIHMSYQTFSNIVQILFNDLQLIYIMPIRDFCVVDDKEKYITLQTIFTNTYCRHHGKLWKEGSLYYTKEANMQKDILKKQFNKNKNIRLNQKINTSCEEQYANLNNNWVDLI